MQTYVPKILQVIGSISESVKHQVLKLFKGGLIFLEFPRIPLASFEPYLKVYKHDDGKQPPHYRLTIFAEKEAEKIFVPEYLGKNPEWYKEIRGIALEVRLPFKLSEKARVWFETEGGLIVGNREVREYHQEISGDSGSAILLEIKRSDTVPYRTGELLTLCISCCNATPGKLDNVRIGGTIIIDNIAGKAGGPR